MNIVGLLAFLTLTALTGFASLILVSPPRGNKKTIGLGEILTALTFGFCLVGHLAIALIAFEVFSLPVLVGCQLATLLVLSLGLLGLKRRLFRFNFQFATSHITLLALVLFGAYLRFPASNYSAGGQDQGIYVNLGHHLAKNGTSKIFDPLLPQLNKASTAHKEYLYRNYYGFDAPELSQGFEGYFIPGIYVKDTKQAELVPQLYHLHPAWFAISEWVLGRSLSTFPLILFGTLSIIAIYAIVKQLTQREAPALTAALLLALNPFHIYFSKLPLAEIGASFFFLCGIAHMLSFVNSNKAGLWAACLCFSCLCLTRITGLLLIPPLMLFVAIRLSLAPNSKQAKSLIGFIAIFSVLFVWSYYHGLAHSYPYSLLSYRALAGIDIAARGQSHLIPLAILAALLCLKPFSTLLKNWIKAAWKFLQHRRSTTAWLLVLTILVLAFARGAALAYGISQAPHLEKWQLPGGGLDTLRRLNLATLVTMSGLPTFLLGVVGWVVVVRRSLLQSKYLCFACILLCYLAAFLVLRRVTPFLFYYSRYLVGELLPLTIVTAAVSFDLVIRYASRHQRKLWASFAIPIFLIWPILSDAFYLSEKTELSGFSMRLEELSSSLTPDSVLFIHESYFPSVLTTLPLRLKHEVKTFRFKLTSTFSKSDLRETMNSFRAKGHEVYLTTTQQTFKHTQNLKFEKKIVLPYRKFEESHFDTPKQFTKRFFSLYLYKYTLEPIEISRSSS